MYIDKDTMISSAQAVTVTAASTDVIDLGVARDIGVGTQKYLMVTTPTAVTATGAATVTFTLQKATDAAFSSPVDVVSSGAIGKALLSPTAAVPFVLFLPIPHGTDYRYIRLNYTVATGPLTAGTFTAAVVEGQQLSKAYASSGA